MNQYTHGIWTIHSNTYLPTFLGNVVVMVFGLGAAVFFVLSLLEGWK